MLETGSSGCLALEASYTEIDVDGTKRTITCCSDNAKDFKSMQKRGKKEAAGMVIFIMYFDHLGIHGVPERTGNSRELTPFSVWAS